jgi:ABC-type nitrate/sulfonate/bicarbonate transport system substrate-binding protein
VAGAAALYGTLGHHGAWAAGSDAPEKKEVKIGFIPLTDCASVVMASVLGFDQKYGVKIVPSKEASWAGVRDKLVNGELDFAHVLYGLVYGLHLGVGGPRKDMAVLMSLNNNGQAITLSKALADKGAVDGASLAKVMAREKREYTFAGTFPTGTHAMWMHYWLAAAGINPSEAKLITVPPPQMVANMRVGNMDGFCVGEPWNHRAIMDGRHHGQYHAGHLEGSPREGAGHHGRVRAEEPQHLPRRDDGDSGGRPLDRRQPAEQDEDGRDRGPEVLHQHQCGRHQPAHSGPLPERPGQDLGRPQPHEVLQRGP